MRAAQPVSRSGRRLAGTAAMMTVLMLPVVAWADCNSDLGVLMNKRMADVAGLNKITKSNGGKLDPITACPRLRSLAATEASVVAYMNKNKEWCSIPDELVTRMSDSRARSAAVAVKACDIAVKIRKMQAQQQQQAQAGTPPPVLKLPAGPL